MAIGNAVWTVENLKFDSGEGCYSYDDDPAQDLEMGRLYTWQAAVNAAEQIPGWHLPTKTDWIDLITICGKDSAGYLTLISEEIGFTLQSAGVRVASGRYQAKGMGIANYWSSTTCDTSDILAYSVGIMGNLQKISPHNYPKRNACSVRLVKDK